MSPLFTIMLMRSSAGSSGSTTLGGGTTTFSDTVEVAIASAVLPSSGTTAAGRSCTSGDASFHGALPCIIVE